MITITFSQKQTQLISCEVKGHAEYDDPGYDIVCAAVSVLICTSILGLQKIAEQEGVFETREGYSLISLSGDITDESQVILKTMKLGLAEIARQYSDFVRLNVI